MTDLSTASRRGTWYAPRFLMVASIFAGCGPTSSLPTSPTRQVITQPVQPLERDELLPGRLFGVVSELTAGGLMPLEGVELYCEACAECSHTFTDADGAYDFGPGGIWWSPGFQRTTITVKKDRYDDPGGIPIGPSSHWTLRYVPIDGDTRFDFQLVRR